MSLVLCFDPAHNEDGYKDENHGGVSCFHPFRFYFVIRVPVVEKKSPGLKPLSYFNAGFAITFHPYKVISDPGQLQ